MRFFKALVSNEEEGYQILKRLDADYVALTFGGYNAHETDGSFIFYEFLYYRNCLSRKD